MANRSALRKSVRILLRSLLVIFVLLNFIIAMHAWSFTHFYDDPALRQPKQSGLLASMKMIFLGVDIPKKQNDSITALPHTTVQLATSDGLKIEGWDIPCKGIYKDSLAGADHKGTILMFHGHGSCRASMLNECYAFLQMGYNVFMIDFRAHGKSEGEQCLVGIKETADVQAAYEYVRERGEHHIVMYGFSMGAATIIKAVHDLDLHPDKLILEMPFASMVDATKGKLRLMHLPEALAGPVMFWGSVLNAEWAFNYKPYNEAKTIQCPVLLQWGRKDPRVNEKEITSIFSNISSEKKLVIYELAAHESLYKTEPAKWLKQTGSFLQ